MAGRSETRRAHDRHAPAREASAKWLADYFQKIGLKPFGKDFIFPFEFNSGERVLPDQTHLDHCRRRKTGDDCSARKGFPAALLQ